LYVTESLSKLGRRDLSTCHDTVQCVDHYGTIQAPLCLTSVFITTPKMSISSCVLLRFFHIM